MQTKPALRLSLLAFPTLNMEEIKTSPPPPRPPPPPTTTTSTASPRRKPKSSTASRMKRSCLSFSASLHESISYVKATIIGQVKKMSARNEKEAAETDLQAVKMQVEVTDAAEDTKMKLQKSI